MTIVNQIDDKQRLFISHIKMLGDFSWLLRGLENEDLFRYDVELEGIF